MQPDINTNDVQKPIEPPVASQVASQVEEKDPQTPLGKMLNFELTIARFQGEGDDSSTPQQPKTTGSETEKAPSEGNTSSDREKSQREIVDKLVDKRLSGNNTPTSASDNPTPKSGGSWWWPFGGSNDQEAKSFREVIEKVSVIDDKKLATALSYGDFDKDLAVNEEMSPLLLAYQKDMIKSIAAIEKRLPKFIKPVEGETYDAKSLLDAIEVCNFNQVSNALLMLEISDKKFDIAAITDQSGHNVLEAMVVNLKKDGVNKDEYLAIMKLFLRHGVPPSLNTIGIILEEKLTDLDLYLNILNIDYKSKIVKLENTDEYLIKAAKDGRAAVVKYLVLAGADLNTAANDEEGLTPLMYAVKGGYYDPTPDKEKDTVVYILSTEVDSGRLNIDAVDKKGRTSLMHAVDMGNPDIVTRLTHKKANCNIADLEGITALIRAVIKGDIAIIGRLLDKGAEINLAAKTDEKLTPLMYAVKSENPKAAVEMLLKRRAEVNAKDQAGRTALVHAMIIGNVDVVEILNKNGADSKYATRWIAEDHKKSICGR